MKCQQRNWRHGDYYCKNIFEKEQNLILVIKRVMMIIPDKVDRVFRESEHLFINKISFSKIFINFFSFKCKTICLFWYPKTGSPTKCPSGGWSIWPEFTVNQLMAWCDELAKKI